MQHQVTGDRNDRRQGETGGDRRQGEAGETGGDTARAGQGLTQVEDSALWLSAFSLTLWLLWPFERLSERRRPRGLDGALYILVFLCRMPSRVFALGKYSVTASILVHVLPKSAKLDRTLM